MTNLIPIRIWDKLNEKMLYPYKIEYINNSYILSCEDTLKFVYVHNIVYDGKKETDRYSIMFGQMTKFGLLFEGDIYNADGYSYDNHSPLKIDEFGRLYGDVYGDNDDLNKYKTLEVVGNICENTNIINKED